MWWALHIEFYIQPLAVSTLGATARYYQGSSLVLDRTDWGSQGPMRKEMWPGFLGVLLGH